MILAVVAGRKAWSADDRTVLVLMTLNWIELIIANRDGDVKVQRFGPGGRSVELQGLRA